MTTCEQKLRVIIVDAPIQFSVDDVLVNYYIEGWITNSEFNDRIHGLQLRFEGARPVSDQSTVLFRP